MKRLRGHWQLLTLTALLLLLWDTAALFPAKMLVIFLHELSHGLAAWLTGGTVREMSLSPMQGGHAITTGGNAFAIISAGYVGSLLFGILLFLLAVRTRFDRAALGFLGAVMIMVSVFYMNGRFPVLYGLTTGGALCLIAWFLPRDINDLLLRTLGLINMIYVPRDIFSDTLARSGSNSDARILSQVVGGPTIFWGILWLGISLLCIAACLRYGLGQSSNIDIALSRQKSGTPSA